MRYIYNTIKNNCLVSGENGKHLIYIKDLKELLEMNSNDILIIQEKYDNNPKKSLDLFNLKFPLLIFEDLNSPNLLFDRTSSRREIISEAVKFFDKKKEVNSVWEFENYLIYEESDKLRFENHFREVLGYVTNHSDYLKNELNKGSDPLRAGL